MFSCMFNKYSTVANNRLNYNDIDRFKCFARLSVLLTTITIFIFDK